ncbi:MAG: hypothetical protein JW885_09930 [Deltaproteobacteria bacterium]|nr:hypothetical protein [Candidatus Zymogenaceae bacterium]
MLQTSEEFDKALYKTASSSSLLYSVSETSNILFEKIAELSNQQEMFNKAIADALSASDLMKGFRELRINYTFLEEATRSNKSLAEFAENNRIIAESINRNFLNLATIERNYINFDLKNAFWGQLNEVTINSLGSTIENMDNAFLSLVNNIKEILIDNDKIISLFDFAAKELVLSRQTLLVFDKDNKFKSFETFEGTPSTVDVLSEVEELLAQMDPNFRTMLRGAIDASKSSNPDKTRHCFSSLRVLLTHVLHEIAPESEVMEWICINQKKSVQYIHDGRPTRRGRLSYFFDKTDQSESNSNIPDFVDKDIKCILEIIEILHSVHSRSLEYSDEQIDIVIYNVSSKLHFLLKKYYSLN